ncbi:hypothetical protein [Bacillus massilinigeriensis]|uniref:hypothetical protein n=1 Tax=Bacillus massilionigeriensis TaxID=1805475 RepID=UPI000B24B218|nr:hypothetical protein [Bacillus massilionigeriensis]
MRNGLYMVYAVILGVVSFFTHEIVTYVMLGFILLSLNNIHGTLKKILQENIDRNK